MEKNPKFLKKLLTTASALSIAAFTASSAMAAPGNRTLVGTPAIASTGANLDGGGAMPLAVKSLVTFTGNAQTLNLDALPGAGFQTYTIDNGVAGGAQHNGNMINVSGEVLFMGLANTADVNRININAKADGAFIIFGRNGPYIAANYTPEATAIIDNYSPAVVDFLGTNNVIFEPDTGYVVGGDLNVHLQATRPVGGGAASDHGTVALLRNARLSGGFAEAARAIGNIRIYNDNVSLTLVRNPAALAAAQAIDANAKDLNLTQGISGLTNNTGRVLATVGDYDMDVATIDNVSLELGGNSIIKGIIGGNPGMVPSPIIGGPATPGQPVDHISVTAGHTVELRGVAAGAAVAPAFDVTVGSVNLSGANATIKLSNNAQRFKGNINNTVAAVDGVYANAGRVKIDGNQAYTFVGNMGAADKKLQNINFDGAVGANSRLNLGTNSQVYVGEITTDVANKGTIAAIGDGVQLSGNIGTNAAPIRGIELVDDGTAGHGVITNFTITAGSNLFLERINLGSVNNILTIEKGVTIHGAIENKGGSGANTGNIVFKPTLNAVGAVPPGNTITVDGDVGNIRSLNQISLVDGGIVDFQGGAGVNMAFRQATIAADTTMKLSTRDRNLTGNITGAGNVELHDNHGYVLAGSVGIAPAGAVPANKVGAVKFTRDAAAAAGAPGARFNISGNLYTQAVTTDTTKKGSLQFDGNVAHNVMTPMIGTDAHRLASIDLTHAAAATQLVFMDTAPVVNIYADDITTDANGQGTVIIRQKETHIHSNIGTAPVAGPGGAAAVSLASLSIVDDGTAAHGAAIVKLEGGRAIYSNVDLGALANNLTNILNVSNNTQIIGNINNAGNVSFADAATVTGNVGNVTPVKIINVNSAGNVVELIGTAGAAQVVNAQTISFNNANATLRISSNNAAVSQITGNLVNNIAGDGSAGIVQFNGDKAYGINGRIGTLEKPLTGFAFVNANANSALTVTNNDGLFVGNITTDKAGFAQVNVRQPNQVIHANIGAANLKLARFGIDIGGGNIPMADNKSVYTTDVEFSGAGGTLTLGDKSDIYSNVVKTGGVANLTFNGSSKVIGNVGSAAAIDMITLNNGSNVEFRGTNANENMMFAAINFAAANAEFKLSTNNRILTGNLVNTTPQNAAGVIESAGKVTLDEHEYLFNGQIGAQGRNLKEFEFTNDGGIHLTGGTGLFVDTVKTKTNGQGTIYINQANTVIVGDIGEENLNLKQLFIVDNGGNLVVPVAPTAPATVTLADNKSIYANVDMGVLDNTLVLGDATKIVGNVSTAADGKGVLRFNGSTLVKGAVASGNRLDKIILAGDGKVVEFTGSAATPDMKFGTVEFNTVNTTMKLSGNPRNLHGNLINTSGHDNAGTLEISGNHSIDGDIGIAGASILNVLFSGEESALTLKNGHSLHTAVVETEVNGTGKLFVDGDHEYIMSSPVGTGENSLETLGFVNAAEHSRITLSKGGDLFVDNFTTDNDGYGFLKVMQGATNINSNVGTESKKIHTLEIDSNGQGAATKVTLNANKSIYTDSGINLSSNTATKVDNIFVLEDKTKVVGLIETENDSQGSLLVTGSSVVEGSVSGYSKINKITLANNTAHLELKGQTGVDSSMIQAQAIEFAAADATLVLSTNSRNVVSNLVNTMQEAGSAGNLVLKDKDHTLSGKVGTADRRMKSIVIDGSNLVLRNGVDLFVDNIYPTEAEKSNITIHQPLTNIDGVIVPSNLKLSKLTVSDDGNAAIADLTSAVVNISKSALNFEEVSLGNMQNNTINLKASQLTVDKMASGTAGYGNIGFEGSNAITTTEWGNKLGNINSTARDSYLEIVGNTLATNANLHENSIIILDGTQLNIDNVMGVGDNNGVLQFDNAQKAKFTANTLGTKGHSLQGIAFAGNDVNIELTAVDGVVDNNMYVQRMAFGSDKSINVTINRSLNGTNVDTVSTKSNQNIILLSDQQITGKIGTQDNPLGNFVLNNSNMVLNTKDFFASVTTNTQNQGTLSIVTMPTGLRSVGSTTMPLGLIELDTNNGNANLYASTINIINSIDDLNPSTLNSNNLVLVADEKDNGGVQVSFLAGRITNKITSLDNGADSLRFKGDTIITKDIGAKEVALKAISFDSNLTFEDNAALYAENTSFAQSDLKQVQFAKGVSGKNITFNGNVDATNRNFVTGQNNFVFNDNVNISNSSISASNGGVVSFNGAVNASNVGLNIDSGSTIAFAGGYTSAFTGNTSINLQITKDTVGTIAADGQGTVVDFSKVDAGSNINITLASSGRVTTQQYSIIKTTNNGKVILGDNFTYNHNDRFSTWTIVDAEKGIFELKDNSTSAIVEILTDLKANAETVSVATALANAPAGTTAAKAFDEVLDITRADEKSGQEALDRMSSNTVIVTAEATKSATAQVTARMGDMSNALVNQDDSVVNPISVAPAAGERDVLRYGVWANPFYGQGTQKERKGVSGYRSRSVGGTVGFDTMANDTMLVGVAATIAKTDIKHKNINDGDKSKINTLLFSVYGLQLVNDQFFVQGAAALGSSKVKNTSVRIGYSNGAITRNTVSGHYDSMSWGGELMAGFNISSFGLANMTPMFGMDYSRVNDSGFKEDSNTNQNFTIYSKPVESLRAIAGVKATVFSTNYNNMYITPEVHAFVKQNLITKNPGLNVTLDGTPIPVKNIKPAKTSYNLGASLNATNGMMQYGITYDANLAHKYRGHQGSIKLRVNF